MMVRLLRALVAASIVALLASLTVAGSAGAQGFHLVTNENDSGPGSFRDALDQAECGGGVIVFAPEVTTIELLDGLQFDCSDTNLTIRAPGVTITPAAGWTGATEADLIDVIGSGRITINGLTIMGDGTSGEDGIDVDTTGPTTVVLRDVTISDVVEDGVDIDEGGFAVLDVGADDEAELEADDQSDGGGDRAGGVGAQALFGTGGVTLQLIDTEIIRSDVDGESNGIDFDTCGDGTVELVRSQVFESGGEGVNIDEGCSGSISLNLTDSDVVGNGDEGVEIDEEGDGNVSVVSTVSAVNGNGADDEEEDSVDEGYEFDEYGDGDLTVTFNGGVANANAEDGVDASEDGAGRLRFTANDSSFDNNGEDGLDLDENDSGSQVVSLRDTSASGNGDGVSTNDAGLEIDGDNFTRVAVRNSSLTGNAGGSGIDIDVPIGFGYSLGTDLSANADGPVDSTIPFFTLS